MSSYSFCRGLGPRMSCPEPKGCEVRCQSGNQSQNSLAMWLAGTLAIRVSMRNAEICSRSRPLCTPKDLRDVKSVQIQPRDLLALSVLYSNSSAGDMVPRTPASATACRNESILGGWLLSIADSSSSQNMSLFQLDYYSTLKVYILQYLRLT
jgi:hypothetical protein